MTETTPCNACRGEKTIRERPFKVSPPSLRFPYGGHRELITIVCPQCAGKGYCDQEDRNRYLRNMGLLG